MHRTSAMAAHFREHIEALEKRTLLSLSAVSNVQVTSDPGVQQEPSIVVDPLARKHIVITYMDRSLVSSGYAGVGVSVTNNGGRSWTRSSIPLPAGFEQGAANPVARFDDQGHLF